MSSFRNLTRFLTRSELTCHANGNKGVWFKDDKKAEEKIEQEAAEDFYKRNEEALKEKDLKFSDYSKYLEGHYEFTVSEVFSKKYTEDFPDVLNNFMKAFYNDVVNVRTTEMELVEMNGDYYPRFIVSGTLVPPFIHLLLSLTIYLSLSVLKIAGEGEGEGNDDAKKIAHAASFLTEKLEEYYYHPDQYLLEVVKTNWSLIYSLLALVVVLKNNDKYGEKMETVLAKNLANMTEFAKFLD